jgi:serine/threonine protein kinase
MTDAGRSSVDPSTRVDYAALPLGSRVGRYEVVSVLGHGSFGITYLARDAQLGREVALKEYLPGALAVRQGGSSVLPRSTEMADDFGWGRTRFIEEGRTLASLHEAPSIVEVFDFLEANGTAYIVMQLLRGQTLERRIRDDGPISPATLDTILWPLLTGLQQVHEAGFLHRDIKPGNIMLGPHDKATLIDFGASRAAMAGRTGTMTAVFTPGYAAPEQFSSARQGPWTDIYGLGATLHYAITGEAPPNAFDRLMKDTYQPLVDRQPRFPSRSVLAGIDAALAVHAEERPQTIADWRAMLQRPAPPDAVTVLMPRQPTVSRPPAPAPARSGRTKWLTAVAALVLLGAGGHYALSVLQPMPDPPPQTEARGQGSTPVVEPPRNEVTRPAAADEARRKSEASAALAQQNAAAEAQARREAEAKSKSEEEARARAVQPPASGLDGTFGGNLSETNHPGGRVTPTTLQLAGTVLSGQIVYQRCAAVPVSLAVSPSGEISGNVRLPDVMACALTNTAASGRVTNQGLQLELRGPGIATRGTLTRSTPIAAPAAPSPQPAVAPVSAPVDPRIFNGVYAGSLTSSTPGGGQTGMRPVGVDLRVSDGRVTGKLVHPTCGAASISLPVDGVGTFGGTVRIYDTSGCSMNDAAVSGRVTASALTLDIRGVNSRAHGSLSKRPE